MRDWQFWALCATVYLAPWADRLAGAGDWPPAGAFIFFAIALVTSFKEPGC